jgi:monofunctional biosynthetic peptidoglycan transglycosylase
MVSLNTGSADDTDEDGTRYEPPFRAGPRPGKKPLTLSRFLRKAVRIVFGLALLWVALVFWLGLSYVAIPPVSTLMLGRWLTLQEANRDFVPLAEISPYLPLAVMTAEDGRFCEHDGVDWDALREVIDDEDGPSRGASTIPMQVAKNLFLWPSRSYLRKGLEIPIALYIDFVWPKRRMMENYLNIAEWGEGIFGAEAAARTYFRKSARNLTRSEAALLARALPNPIIRNPARPSGRYRALAVQLAGRMEAMAPDTSCLKE